MRKGHTLRVASILVATLAFMAGGCGALVTPTYSNQLVNAAGRALSVEDLEQIAQRTDQSDDEKRALFRTLGIEDEKLIDALLGL